MKTLAFLLLLAVAACAETSVIVVAGAGGTPEYTSAFGEWAGRWQKAAAAGAARSVALGLAGEDVVREKVRAALESEAKDGAGELWLVLLGHGTWDGKNGRFNVTGDDISIDDLAGWLAPFKRPVVVIAGFSASGAFLKPLSAPGRVVVTGTRAGGEENYARFGDYLSRAIGDAAADLDKDGEVSLFEAWLTAARQTASFYADEGRLATEHPLLDDNGDGLGTPVDWYEGTRVVKKAKSGELPDGLRARQLCLVRSAAEQALSPEVRARRDALELEVARLREAKAGMKEGEYFEKLEKLMLELARVYGGS